MKHYNKINYEKYKEYRKEYEKTYRLKKERKEYKKKHNKKYYLDNKKKINEYVLKYYLDNKKDIFKKQKERRKNDILFKLTGNMRRRMAFYLKKDIINKNTKTFQMIGCQPIELKKHLEKQFVEGMSWDNYGEWHIDHIIPLSSAKDEKQLLKLCYYTNLQPLWAFENISKGANV